MNTLPHLQVPTFLPPTEGMLRAGSDAIRGKQVAGAGALSTLLDGFIAMVQEGQTELQELARWELVNGSGISFIGKGATENTFCKNVETHSTTPISAEAAARVLQQQEQLLREATLGQIEREAAKGATEYTERRNLPNVINNTPVNLLTKTEQLAKSEAMRCKGATADVKVVAWEAKPELAPLPPYSAAGNFLRKTHNLQDVPLSELQQLQEHVEAELKSRKQRLIRVGW